MKNASHLRSEHKLESLVSRESSFLFNNLLLLVACFTVLWGTLFPILSEWVQGHKVTVGPPFFNRVSIPVALLLLLADRASARCWPGARLRSRASSATFFGRQWARWRCGCS